MMQQTSLLAYQDLGNDVKAERYRNILSALLPYNGLTDREITHVLGYLDPNMVRPRRNELVKMGLIYASGKKVCSITKKTALIWSLRPKKSNISDITFLQAKVMGNQSEAV